MLHVCRLLTAVVVFVSVPRQLLAQETWKQLGPDGGYVDAIAIDPVTPTTLYAGTAYGGVFRSVDSGASWSAVNVGLSHPYHGLPVTVGALAVDPVTPSILYAGINDDHRNFLPGQLLCQGQRFGLRICPLSK